MLTTGNITLFLTISAIWYIVVLIKAIRYDMQANKWIKQETNK